MVAAWILYEDPHRPASSGRFSSALAMIHLPANVTVKAQRVKQPAQLSLAVQLPDDETFVSFYPGNNAHLITALKMRPLVRAHLSSISGGQGSGRSHLLHATCAEVNARDAAAAYLSSISSNSWIPACSTPSKACRWSVSTAWRRSPAMRCGSGPCSILQPLAGEGRGYFGGDRVQRAAQTGAAAAGSRFPA